jgi:hypothetical protein
MAKNASAPPADLEWRPLTEVLDDLTLGWARFPVPAVIMHLARESVTDGDAAGYAIGAAIKTGREGLRNAAATGSLELRGRRVSNSVQDGGNDMVAVKLDQGLFLGIDAAGFGTPSPGWAFGEDKDGKKVARGPMEWPGTVVGATGTKLYRDIVVRVDDKARDLLAQLRERSASAAAEALQRRATAVEALRQQAEDAREEGAEAPPLLVMPQAVNVAKVAQALGLPLGSKRGATWDRTVQKKYEADAAAFVRDQLAKRVPLQTRDIEAAWTALGGQGAGLPPRRYIRDAVKAALAGTAPG